MQTAKTTTTIGAKNRDIVPKTFLAPRERG
jgi:hypothetical protein